MYVFANNCCNSYSIINYIKEDKLKKYKLYEVDKNYKEPFLDNHKVRTITLKANEFLNVGGGKLWFVDKQHAEQHLEQLPTCKEYHIKNRLNDQ